LVLAIIDRKWDFAVLRSGSYPAQWEHHIWSRGEDLMTDCFPEFALAARLSARCSVRHHVVLAFQTAPMSFNALQKRIGRKTVPKKLLAEAPVILMVYLLSVTAR
jgi:DNA ligase-1